MNDFESGRRGQCDRIGLFYINFRGFQTNNTILQKSNVKKCHIHPVYGTRIQTYDLSNTSHLP